ncbi:MAG: hypothetical protein LBI13_10720 [Streptococcaceae bacterium]|jgi:hypothetical protein|nr:hypothetical protein [Streptococcaceae bacterium]
MVVTRNQFLNVSDFDSAFDSQILSESHSQKLFDYGFNVSSESEGSQILSTASEFDFEILSESAKILRDAQMSSLKDEFPDFSLLEDLKDSSIAEESFEDQISDFAYRLLHDKI